MIKAFLGMGLLGANFVQAMLERGDIVRVWNRTLSKAKALEAFGAMSFERVEEAVQGADLVHMTLKDDAAVDEVLEKAGAGLQPGAIIIDHTTTSAGGAIERTEVWKKRGFAYQHAPVFMGPQNARERSGFMLVSGEQHLITKVQAHLTKMTGTLLNFGPESGKAAGLKLTGNLFLLALTAGLSEAVGLAKVHGITHEELLLLLTNWNPGITVPARLQKMTTGKFDEPSWELNMARKDAGLMLQAAHERGIKLAVMPAIASLMDQWIDKGHGADDWSVIAKDHL
jgi:3-hydroxyisobutyrate dehydrogenase